MTENLTKETLHADSNADNNQDSGIQFDEDDNNGLNDNQLKERTKRKRKKRKKNKSKNNIQETDEDNKSGDEAAKEKIDVAIEYIPETPEIDPHDPNYRYFLKVFSNFKVTAESINNPKGADGQLKQEGKDREEGGRNKFKIASGATMTDSSGKPTTHHQMKEAPVFEEKEEEEDSRWRRDLKGEDGEDKPTKLSKKKWKLQNRLSVAELKQLVKRPDVVEMHDVTALDPKLLVHLKASRNSVPVARHWCFKRKYLAGKRGFEKPPFELPDFIKKTGIMEMRQALQDKEDATSLKTKMRAKIRPKMGKIDIDYQKLHDAFFRWQTKPKLTHHGDLYYEGKELEIRLKEKKPGDLSTELREALNMPTGLSADKVPPPWLIAMQRYGPPPSYPGLKIPGLNAPIPEGCSFGYHAGGWGKPPVDEFGKPLYGDVFNTQMQEYKGPVYDEEVDKTPWGELESESEEEESSEEETENKLQTDNPAEIVSGFITPSEAGLITPSGVASTPMGMETPDVIELRKKKIENEMEVNSELPPLYTILPEKATNIGGDFLGSTHVYDMSAVAAGPQSGSPSVSNPSQSNKGVEVTLAPEELDLVDTTDVMAFRYEQQIKAQSGIQTTDKNDLSDMVAQHAIKQKNKRKKLQEKETSKPAKKYKDFKF